MFLRLFVLSHNVFFHKQVTFNARGKHGFWVVRKTDGQTSIDKHDTKNPVRTAYGLLWNELKAKTPSRTAQPNALRRILEYYFKILGGYDFDKLLQEFEGEDKLVVNSLISWAHAGSHADIDDIGYMTDNLEAQCRLFKRIFEKTGNIDHYNMMMGEDVSNELAD
jgi:wobble nucleotide-excising tRNase